MIGRGRRDDRIETGDESQRGRAREIRHDPIVLLPTVGGTEPRAAPPPDRVRDSDRAGAPARHRLRARKSGPPARRATPGPLGRRRGRVRGYDSPRGERDPTSESRVPKGHRPRAFFPRRVRLRAVGSLLPSLGGAGGRARSRPSGLETRRTVLDLRGGPGGAVGGAPAGPATAVRLAAAPGGARPQRPARTRLHGGGGRSGGPSGSRAHLVSDL